MSILLWIIFGAIAGWVASLIVGNDAEQGVIGNIVVGVLGALVGGFIISMLGGSGIDGFNLSSMLVAIFGSVVLLFGYRAVTTG